MKAFLMLSVLALGGLALGCGDIEEESTNTLILAHVIDDKTKPTDPEPISCEPGAMYVCDCGNGNLGNKFCAWTGDAFGVCELCGEAGTELLDTGIYCNEHPDTANNEELVLCAPVPEACAPVACSALTNTCVIRTAIPLYGVDDDANNCAQTVCDGFGNAVSVPDPSDCVGSCDSAGACVP